MKVVIGMNENLFNNTPHDKRTKRYMPYII